jgi:hypothetical protein
MLVIIVLIIVVLVEVVVRIRSSRLRSIVSTLSIPSIWRVLVPWLAIVRVSCWIRDSIMLRRCMIGPYWLCRIDWYRRLTSERRWLMMHSLCCLLCCQLFLLYLLVRSVLALSPDLRLLRLLKELSLLLV